MDNGLSTIDCQQRRRVVGLIGCMAVNRGEEILKKMPHINLVCGPAAEDKILQYVEEIRQSGKRILDLEDRVRSEDFYAASWRLDDEYAQVVISTGCSNYCSYCVVPFVRGAIRPRNPEDIAAEVIRNVKLGIKKITLLGQNVNDYQYMGQEAGGRGQENQKINFVELLKITAEIKGVEELNFLTSHPKNTSRELFETIAKYPNIKKHLHLPMQSGSDRILALMNRGYTAQGYLKLAGAYKSMTGGTLSTDIIVGFPTESDEDFNLTRKIIEDTVFSGAFIFKYSPRPGTKAFELVDDVPKEVKERRHGILLELQRKIAKMVKRPQYD